LLNMVDRDIEELITTIGAYFDNDTVIQDPLSGGQGIRYPGESQAARAMLDNVSLCAADH